ncbi:unnamed protein product [Leuciscus chuanchicus]
MNMTDENTMDSDYYDLYYEDQMCKKDEVVKVGSILIPLFFSLVVVLSCIGNILVLVTLALYENVFILNLALSNLLFTFGLPFWASYFIWGWTFGDIGCKAVKFLFYVGFYSSVLFLTLMTIQRYMAVVHPLSDWEKCRGFSVAPFIVWILSGAVSLLENIMTEDYTSTDYDDTPVDQLCRKEEVVKVGSIVIPVFFALLVVLSCIGNLLVLVILVLYEKFRSMINILILNLALSDLLFTFGLPFWASYFIWGWTFGEIGCKAVKFLFYVGFYSSVLFLTLMTIQRYMAVVHPLSDWEKCRGFSVAPFIIWILSGAAALLVSLRSKNNMTEEETLNPVYNEHSDNYDSEYDELCRKDEVVKVGSIISPLFFSLAVALSCICKGLVVLNSHDHSALHDSGSSSV